MSNILTLEEVRATKTSYHTYNNGDYVYRASYNRFCYIKQGVDILDGMQVWSYDSIGGLGYDGGLRLMTQGLIKLRFINVPLLKRIILYFKYYCKR